ncbi:DUF2513 domain-containing protein [Aeromonas sp. 82P]|uniref:DUF2513 domain-containing protein n=1 Tax=Aeromonas sp. 82P TaxID=3452726 RepID=UPI003F78BE4B
MKRDWSIIRDLLIKVEALESPDNGLSLDGFDCPDEKSARLISDHMKLLIQNGFVQGRLLSCEFGPTVDSAQDFLVHALSWEGHDFLDAIRSDTVWNKIKETFATKGIDMTFETIKAVAVAIVPSMLGLSL